MSATPTYIHGIGTAVPSQALGPEESVELFRQAYAGERPVKLMRRIVRLTGIARRHLAVLDYQHSDDAMYRPHAEQPRGPGMAARSALFDRAAPPLVRAALRALPGASAGNERVLVTASCTHASAPGLEQAVLAAGAVGAHADRWNLGFMGCSAGLAALRLVHGLDATRRAALVVACELSSLHFQYSDALDQLTANLLFADGAAAVRLGVERSAIAILDGACAALPAAADQMVWTAGDNGLQLVLSQELPDTLAGALPPVVDRFLERNGLARGDVRHWLAHPGGPQILDAVEACLGLPGDTLALSRAVLRDYGNMSSPTILFILKALIDSRQDGACVAVAFGPGLTIELLLLRIDRSGRDDA